MAFGDEKLVSELVGHAYDAALGRASWTAFTQAMADALGSGSTHILVARRERQGDALFAAVRSDPLLQREYLAHYSSVNPYLTHPAAPRMPGVVHNGEWFPRSEIVKTEFYNDFLRRSDVFPVLVGNLFADRCREGFFASYRRFHGKPHGARERRLLALVLPHLRRAIQISGLVAQSDLERRSWSDCLDLFEHAVVLLDADGAPLFLNDAARRLVSADGLSVSRPGLRASYSPDQRRLKALIASAARTTAGRGLAAGGCLAVRRPSGRPPLGLMVTPLPRRAAAVPAFPSLARMPAVAVFVTDPAAKPARQPAAALLACLFELTPREAEVACLLARGLSVPAVAERLSIAYHTARVHQRRVYDKVGVHSQAELVCRIPTLPGGSSTDQAASATADTEEASPRLRVERTPA